MCDENDAYLPRAKAWDVVTGIIVLAICIFAIVVYNCNQ